MSVAKAAAPPAPAGTAYADDSYTWTQEQGARLRAGDPAGLDLANLAEEVESLGRTEFSSLVGARRAILTHMPKFDHRPEKRTRSWALSIAEQRAQAGDVLADNPGLKSRLDDALARAYRGARPEASKKAGIPLKHFPVACPYTQVAMLTRPFPIDPDDA